MTAAMPVPWSALLPEVRFAVTGPAGDALPAAPAPSSAAGAALVREALRAADVLDELLQDAAAEAGELLVVVNDDQRPTATAPVLAELCARADEVGADGLRLRLLVACGTHAPGAAARQAHEARVAGALARQRRLAGVAWHDARAEGRLRGVGTWRLHELVVAAPQVVGVGSIEPHYFAGATGAHKTLTVGVASFDDVERNHRAALSADAAPLRLAGNPVHEGIAAAVEALGRGRRVLAVNEVVCGGALQACLVGAPLEALRAGLPVVERLWARRAEQPLDVVVARVAPPLDRDLYQADKGIKNVEAAVRAGGVLVLEAACSAGEGPDQFLRLLEEAPTHAAALAVLEARGYRLGDHKAVRLRALTDPAVRGVRVAVLAEAEAGAAAARRAGLAAFTDAAAAAAWVRDALGASAPGSGAWRGAVVEDAGHTVLASPAGRAGAAS
jgi:nickel-dependent lactate racemase